MPLRIFEPRYADLVGRCMKDGAGFGVIAITEGSETGLPARTYGTGTVATIVDFDRGNDCLLNIVIRGDGRFRLLTRSIQDDNLLLCHVRYLDDVARLSIPEAFQYLADLLQEIVSNAEVVLIPGPAPSTASQLVYGLAQFLPLTLAAKVRLLEIDNPLNLLKRMSIDVRRLAATSR